MIDERRHHAQNHHDIRAGEPRGGEGRHRSDDDIDFAREHRLERRWARTDTDYFAVEAMLREQAFFLHYPDRAVRRAVAGPRDTDYFAVEAMLREQAFFLHYPDRAVRRAVAGPRDADALLCHRRPANKNESNRGRSEEHT